MRRGGWRRFACALLVCAPLLLFRSIAASWPDLTQSHWAYEDLQRAAARGIIRGFEDGTMRPDAPLTWGQYLVMIDRAFFPEDYANAARELPWDRAGWQVALDKGIITKEDFLPVSQDSLGVPILRQDAAVLLHRVLPSRRSQSGPEDTAAPLSAQESLVDFALLPASHREAVEDLFRAKVIRGREDGAFHGEDSIKRCDGCVLLLRIMAETDDRLLGVSKPITLYLMDLEGTPLCPAQTVEASIGFGPGTLPRGKALERQMCLSDDVIVSYFQDEYILVYRPFTQEENDQADLWEASQKPAPEPDPQAPLQPAETPDPQDQPQRDPQLSELGENAAKHLLLFGQEDKRRYSGENEAKANMATISVPVWRLKADGSKTPSTESISIHAALAEDVVAIFTEIYNHPEQFPILNLGGYSWRGNSAKGEHNCGTAIDINWAQNYQVRNGRAQAGTHWLPGEDPYSMPADGSVVQIFAQHGWSWGGDAWAADSDPTKGYHDYMHFSYMGE